MTVYDTIAAAARAGVSLSLDGDRLRYRAPSGALSPDLRAGLTQHREELRHLLALTPDSPEYGEALVRVAAALGWQRVERRPRCCYGCGGTRWWERPTGGLVCATCHPPPPSVESSSTISAAAARSDER